MFFLRSRVESLKLEWVSHYSSADWLSWTGKPYPRVVLAHSSIVILIGVRIEVKGTNLSQIKFRRFPLFLHAAWNYEFRERRKGYGKGVLIYMYTCM